MKANQGFKETEIGLIPEDWDVDILKNRANIIMGQSPKSKFYNSDAKGMPFMQGRKTFGEKYPTIDTWCTEPKKKANKGSVLMSVRAPVGDVNIAHKHLCIGRGLASIEMKNGNNEFLYYLMKSYKQRIINQETGTVFGSINKSGIENLKFPFPNDKEQKAIASILSALDEKIELNNRINKILEEMARAIFKHWFIDFEFPNENGEPYKSSGGEMVESELGMIPKGWEVKKIGEIVDIFNGYSYKSKELLESQDAMITIKNFDRTGGFKLDGLKEIKLSDRVKEKHYVEKFDLIVAHTDLTQKADIIGNPILIFTKGKYKNLIISMDTVKVSPKGYMNTFMLYLILRDKRFKFHAMSYTSGTTVLHLNKRAIPEYKVSLPTDSQLINNFNEIIEPIFKRISILYEENQILRKARDTLLPKLMSGEIRVNI